MLKLSAVISSSPVEELDGCRLNQQTGLSLFSTVPDAAVSVAAASVVAAAASVVAAASVAAAVEELLLEEEEEPHPASIPAVSTAADRIDNTRFLFINETDLNPPAELGE